MCCLCCTQFRFFDDSTGTTAHNIIMQLPVRLPVWQPLDEVRVAAGEQQHRQRVDGHPAVEAERHQGVRLQRPDGLVPAPHDDLVQHDLRAAETRCACPSCPRQSQRQRRNSKKQVQPDLLSDSFCPDTPCPSTCSIQHHALRQLASVPWRQGRLSGANHQEQLQMCTTAVLIRRTLPWRQDWPGAGARRP
jgi:hypothetical protein